MTDLTGQTFSRLKVLRVAGKASNGEKLYECLCECGKQKTVKGSNLVSGTTKSCGCYRNERVREGRINAGYDYTPKLSYKELIALNKCASCRRDNDGKGTKSLCSICHPISLEANRRYRLKRRESGLCWRCTNPAEPNSATCFEHKGRSGRSKRRLASVFKYISREEVLRRIEKHKLHIKKLEDYLAEMDEEVEGAGALHKKQ